jgi:hypothetical protein
VLTRIAVYEIPQMSAVNSAGSLSSSAESMPLARSMIGECCLRMRIMSRWKSNSRCFSHSGLSRARKSSSLDIGVCLYESNLCRNGSISARQVVSGPIELDIGHGGRDVLCNRVPDVSERKFWATPDILCTLVHPATWFCQSIISLNTLERSLLWGSG